MQQVIRRNFLTHHTLQDVYDANWLWLPFLVLFLVQGLHCSLPVKLVLLKIALYYIVAAIGLQLLLPATHLALRTMLFDLTTRVFLFIQATEILWNSWNARSALTIGGGALKQQKLFEDDEDNEQPGVPRRRGLTPHHLLLILYVISALLYLGWTIVGLTFAFTLMPGM
jgi:hypothetical protein